LLLRCRCDDANLRVTEHQNNACLALLSSACVTKKRRENLTRLNFGFCHKVLTLAATAILNFPPHIVGGNLKSDILNRLGSESYLKSSLLLGRALPASICSKRCFCSKSINYLMKAILALVRKPRLLICPFLPASTRSVPPGLHFTTCHYFGRQLIKYYQTRSDMI
jgi:hypothetical protein